MMVMMVFAMITLLTMMTISDGDGDDDIHFEDGVCSNFKGGEVEQYWDAGPFTRSTYTHRQDFTHLYVIVYN